MSLVHIHGEYVSHDLCGYCHSNNSVSYAITADTLEASTYDRMINMGWRRSGNFLYRPVLHKTCCPSYAIRLMVEGFQISKSQRQVLRRFERYLNTGSVLIESSSMDTHIAPMEVTFDLVAAEFTSERYELYKKYQVAVHQDSPEDVTELAFTRFLCSSPLQTSDDEMKIQYKATTITCGSYHQLYRVNGTLIAVSVIDVLPSGLSSVYAFYDPDKRYLSLGKYTALKEIELCRTLQLKYYYLGFYIHSCAKMRYKGEYHPSELLCPTSFEWYFLKDCVPLIEKHKFTPFQPQLAAERESVPDDRVDLLQKYSPRFTDKVDVVSIRLDLGIDRYLSLAQLNKRGVDILTPILKEFVNQTGSISSELIVKLH